jgi:hypothetical protein
MDKQKDIRKNITLHVLRYDNAEKHSDKYYVLAFSKDESGRFISGHAFYGRYKPPGSGDLSMRTVDIPYVSTVYVKLEEQRKKGYRRVSNAEAEDILTRAGIFIYLGIGQGIYYYLNDGKTIEAIDPLSPPAPDETATARLVLRSTIERWSKSSPDPAWNW